MKESLPWVELGNQPIQGKKTPSNIITSTEQAVKDIIDMLEVAHDQSEIEGKNHITNFFAKSEDIISHLYRTGKINKITQADELRFRVMKHLGIIPDNNSVKEEEKEKAEKKIYSKYNSIRILLKKNENFENRLNQSLKVIIASIDTSNIKTSIQNRWETIDKKYFKFNIRTLIEYTNIIKGYFFQKYGMEFTEENVKKIQEK